MMSAFCSETQGPPWVPPNKQTKNHRVAKFLNLFERVAVHKSLWTPALGYHTMLVFIHSIGGFKLQLSLKKTLLDIFALDIADA
jgi:hypothetical protein